jgi:hypothetical protein
MKSVLNRRHLDSKRKVNELRLMKYCKEINRYKQLYKALCKTMFVNTVTLTDF